MYAFVCTWMCVLLPTHMYEDIHLGVYLYTCIYIYTLAYIYHGDVPG